MGGHFLFEGLQLLHFGGEVGSDPVLLGSLDFGLLCSLAKEVFYINKSSKKVPSGQLLCKSARKTVCTCARFLSKDIFGPCLLKNPHHISKSCLTITDKKGNHPTAAALSDKCPINYPFLII